MGGTSGAGTAYLSGAICSLLYYSGVHVGQSVVSCILLR